MSEVYEPIIRISTSDAQKTVKSLKKDISDLRDVILNLEEGTDEYAAAVKRLQDDQRQLDTVMGLTKKNATALEGSYDALVHQMSLLRKEWKSTNDEARRNELGEQINDLNNKLKEFDASTGNFQRNVGNYTSALDALDDKTVAFKQNMSQMNDSIEPTKAKFESVQKISAGVASGFAAVQGAAALLGKEGKNLEEVFVKVQSAMAIAQGIGGLGDLVEGLGKAKVAFQGVADKIKLISKTMGKAGWIGIIIAVVSAIALLVESLTRTNRQIENGTYGLKKMKEAMKEGNLATAEFVVTTKLFNEVATDASKAEEIRARASDKVLENLGMEITETNRLRVMNGELVGSIEDVTKAYAEQAQAKAMIDMLVESYKEMIDIAGSSPTFWDKIFTWDISSWFDGDKQWWNDDDFGADIQDKRYNRAKKRFDALFNTANKEGFLDKYFGSGGNNNSTNFGELADKAIKELERVNEREKALALQGVTDEKKIAEIEEQYALKLANNKLAILRNYHKQAKALGVQGEKVAKSLSDQIFEIETSKIVQANEQKKRLRKEDERVVREYFATLEENNTLYYKEEHQKLQQQVLTKEEYNAKLAELEVNRITDEKNLLEDKYQWLLLNEEENGEEILQIKSDIYNKGLELDAAMHNRELAIKKKNAEKINEEIAEINAKYVKEELKQDTDFIPELQNRNFWGELFNSSKKQRTYENDVFEDDQAYFDRRATFLEDLKKKYNELLPNVTDEEERLQIEQDIADAEIQIQENAYLKQKAIRDKNYKDEQEKQQGRVALLQASMQATSQILNSIADMYEADGEVNEEEAKKIKNLRMASAYIETLQGAVTAYASAQSIPPPAGPIIGGINAAAVVAMGLANIAKIRNTDVSTSSSGGGGAAVMPQASTYTSELPVQYNRSITGMSEIEQLNRDTRVVLVESDVFAAIEKNRVRISESEF